MLRAAGGALVATYSRRPTSKLQFTTPKPLHSRWFAPAGLDGRSTAQWPLVHARASPCCRYNQNVRGAFRRYANVGACAGWDTLLASRPITAIYPGSFDPITNGHLDLVDRAARLADRLIVAVLRNESKQPLFTVSERTDMLREVVRDYPNVEVDSFDGLLVQYAHEKGARVIFRGIRAISDYEYELQMALMNRRLRPEIETVFLMAGEAYSFVSSRMVTEVIRLGGDISGLVPPPVLARLEERVLRGV